MKGEAVVAVIVALVIGVSLGMGAGRAIAYGEAVEQGHASWQLIGKTSSTEFVWGDK